ncbi:hypothetical protein OPQ81_011147 [Rhizoctonia solani]|nr:hypothetical protein OPQ81_011147 [Rhizoctonia solani]
MSVTISIDPAHTIAPVDDRLYSGFIEHLGRCIYGGIVPDPTTPKDLITPSGFRKDVLHLLRDELKVPIVRWPGGNFVSAYQWQDGIGPAEQRPRRPELAWGSEESNLFGMDEYMTWCKEAKVEPYICLNMGTGTLSDALAWLEYANGTRNTYWANLRRKHTGRDEPYGVKLWGLGNEMYGKWQIGQLPAKEYAQKAHQWAHALKSMDPSIVLVSCGEIGVSSWDYEVLQKLVPWVDYHSIHLYTSPGPDAEFKDSSERARYERNVFGPAAAEKAIDICTGLIDLARIEQNVPKQIKIAFDEWNSWDFTKGTPENGLEQIYDLSDALAIASWMNVFIRKADKVAIACIAQSVNVISPAKLPPLFQAETQPAWSRFAAGPQPYLDTSAVYVEGGEGVGSVRVAVVNRHLELALGASLRFPETLVGSGKVKVRAKYDKFEVWAADVAAANTLQSPEAVKVVQTSEEWDASKPIVFKEHSFTLLVFTFEKA